METPKTMDEALDHFFACLKFFLIRHTLKTVIFLVIAFGGSGWVLNDYFKDRHLIKVVDALPKEDPGGVAVVFPWGELTQENKSGPKIMIEGKFYGYIDTTYIAYVTLDERIFVYDKQARGGIFVDFSIPNVKVQKK